MTDVSTAFTSEFLPEGVKMHNGFRNAFYDSLPSLDKILEDYAEEQGSEKSKILKLIVRTIVWELLLLP
ncbi:hypothetical protein [Wolbachia endosymbiont of Atemnus politus]|nr:hypothetical protein [Wolbachia endosymbiont of Atemnus politus]